MNNGIDFFGLSLWNQFACVNKKERSIPDFVNFQKSFQKKIFENFFSFDFKLSFAAASPVLCKPDDGPLKFHSRWVALVAVSLFVRSEVWSHFTLNLNRKQSAWVETVASRMAQNAHSKKSRKKNLLSPTGHGNAPVSTEIPFQLRDFSLYRK